MKKSIFSRTTFYSDTDTFKIEIEKEKNTPDGIEGFETGGRKSGYNLLDKDLGAKINISRRYGGSMGIKELVELEELIKILTEFKAQWHGEVDESADNH